MAIIPSDYVDEVRLELTDIDSDYLGDEVILHHLNKSWEYINQLADVSNYSDDVLKYALISLASYSTYLAWTTTAERMFDNAPNMVNQTKLEALKKEALKWLKLISDYPLTEDLLVDDVEDYIIFNVGLTYSVVDEDYV